MLLFVSSTVNKIRILLFNRNVLAIASTRKLKK